MKTFKKLSIARTSFAAIFSAVFLLGSVSSYAVEYADDAPAPIQVNQSTPDKVLLQGKNIEKMFSVASPSVSLSFKIEGVEHKVEVGGDATDVILYAHDASPRDIEIIRSAFAAITGEKDVQVNNSASVRVVQNGQ